MVSLHAALLALTLAGVGQTQSPNQTVLLDFCADWCAPCRAMEPTVQELAKIGFPIKKVNIDRDRALAAQYRVQGIPCFVMLVNGQETDRVVGGTSFSRLERMCKAGLAQQQTPAASPLVAEAAPKASPPPSTVPGRNEPRADLPAIVVAQDGVMPSPPSTVPMDPRPVTPASGGADAALIAASVRLWIDDPKGRSCGSGTIIDTRAGSALILTCGHVFRDAGAKGRIQVYLFGPSGVQTVAGELISYDLERDVGLVSAHIPGPVVAARVAPAGYRVKRGDPVTSVGCNNGNQPSARQSRVTSLDKYLGPPNLQVAGQPVEGRSGGGLFASDGYVIGVCNARDPSDQEGLFAAVGSIHAELDRAGLSYIYKAGGEPSAPVSLAAAEPPPMAKQMPRSIAPSGGIATPIVPAVATQSAPGLSAAEQAALDEIRRRLQDGADVICVVRTPQGKSEVIMLSKVSPEFLQQLSSEGQLRETSLEIPHKPAANAPAASSPFPWRR